MAAASTSANQLSPTDQVGPVAPLERIDVIDILRGFAIFRMLLVNIAVFAGQTRFGNWLDLGTIRVMDWFVEGDFIAMFTFLFGLGFALQMERGEGKGPGFIRTYQRRLLVLLLMGVVHMVFLSSMDILHSYALLGFLLLPFRKLAPKTILISALVCAMLPLGWDVIRAASARQSVEAFSLDEREATRGTIRESILRTNSERMQAYRHGSYLSVVAYRVRLWGRLYSSPDWYINQLARQFALFLSGLYIGRLRIFQNLRSHLPFIRRAAPAGLVFGVVAVVLAGMFPPSPIARQLLWFGSMALAFFYYSCVILLAQREKWRNRLRSLEAVGRTALTNYLLQSLVCTTIFYGYGLGYYGRFGAAALALMSIAIFAGEMALSRWWTRHFRFGPVEWLWRSLTYGKAQPFRL